jgi:hypothetical protein
MYLRLLSSPGKVSSLENERTIGWDAMRGAKVSENFAQFWHLLLLYNLRLTFSGFAFWRVLEHKTVNAPQKLMRGRMFN